MIMAMEIVALLLIMATMAMMVMTMVIMMMITETFRNTFTPNRRGRNDHVTMFILYLLLAVFSFSVKFSSFGLASKARIILHHSHLSTYFFKKT